MKKWIEKILEEHGISFAWAIVVLVVGFASPLRNLETWKRYFDLVFGLGTTVDPSTRAVILKPLMFGLLLAFCITWLMWMGFFLQAEIRRKRAVSNRDERATTAYKTMAGMMRAAALIRDQTNPRSQQPLKAFQSIKICFLIDKNFVTETTREYQIFTVGQPLHYWGMSLRASGQGKPADYLDDIHFRAVDPKVGTKVVYLPTRNDPLEKKVTVYFLPRIEPDQPARTVAVSFTWPGYNQTLAQEEREEFSFTFESAAPIDLFEFALYAENMPDRVLRCEITGDKFEDGEIKENVNQGKGWKGYIYTVKKAPSGRNRFAVTARLEKS